MAHAPLLKKKGVFAATRGRVYDKCWLHQMLLQSNHWAHVAPLDSSRTIFPSKVDIEERRNGALGRRSHHTR